MFQDSKSPFAASPSNGSSSSPFQPVGANGSSHSNGSGAASPFGAAATPVPEQKAASDDSSSPFALVKDNGEITNPSSKSSLVEPTEGFAAPEVASPSSPTPPPVAMPKSQDLGANRNDPFAAPTPSVPISSSAPEAAGRSDFVLPAENRVSALPPNTDDRQAVTREITPAPGQITPAAATPAVVSAVTGDTSQLVLRAIFGVTRDLDRDEILQRARALPGIRNLHIVGQNEGAAMASLRQSIQRMGFGDQASLALTTSGGFVDFIEEEGTTLAVLHEGVYAAGVRETLIIVAREFSSLG